MAGERESYMLEELAGQFDPSTFLATGALLSAGYPLARGLLVSVADTYRVYGVNLTGYCDLPLPVGWYVGLVSTKITTVGGANITDGAVIVTP